MKHVIGVADMYISSESGDLLVTHALGSCLGVAIYERSHQIGGLLHVMLPNSSINPSKAEANPFMFVDTGIPAMLQYLIEAGAEKHRMTIKVAGGAAQQLEGEDRFSIGKRNYIMLRKMLWKYGLLLENEDVGGDAPRTMYLDIDSGRVWLNSKGQETDL